MTKPIAVLVTGGAGFIGSHLVDELLARGDTVVALDNFDPFYDPNEKLRNLEGALRHPRFRLVNLDCRDLPALLEQTNDCEFDVVVHLAAKAGVRPSIQDPVGYASVNVMGTQSMLEFAHLRGISRFVFASSSSVYGNNPTVPFCESDSVDAPISPYAATKRSGELLCHAYHTLYGMSVLALRFFTVYGSRQRPDLAIRKFATQMLRSEPITLFGRGTTERDYTWIDDIISGVVAAIDRTVVSPPEYKIINLGESATTPLRRLVELLGTALGVDPEIKEAPPQPGDVERTFADISVARSLLGYAPRTPVEIGIPLFAKWITGLPPQ